MLTVKSIEIESKNNSISLKVENSNLTGTQINIATDNASIIGNRVGYDFDKLQLLVNNLLKESHGLNPSDKEIVEECIEVLETIKDPKPKRSIIKTALQTLQGIAATTEFTAAVVAIVQFFQNL